MHRITLALALIGAVAAVGCGGSATSGGGARGVAEDNFTVTVQNGQNGNDSLAITGGYVTSVPAGINCGAGGRTSCSATFGLDVTVVLTATPTDAGVIFFQWAGDCFGETCQLTGNADRYVLAQFGTPADRSSHPNWSESAVHAAQYRAFALQCNACHGLNWQGLAIAPSCYGCHADFDSFKVNTDVAAVDGHFAQAAEAWTDHGSGWSRSCLRCHTSQGFQDYVGLDGTPNYLDGTFNTTSTLTSTTAACETAGTCNPAAYRFGPLVCKTCHNSKSDPVKSGLTQILFPSQQLVSADTSTALCGQCHQGRESAASLDTRIGTAGPDDLLTTGFRNPHYLGAAGTFFGADGRAWGEYPGKIYTRKNQHAVHEGSCTSCHDPHTGHLPADGAEMTASCGRCHFDEATDLPVATFLQLEESRQFGFEGDIDGDGLQESLKLEIEGLEAELYDQLLTYTQGGGGRTPICYNGASHPYYFNDTGASANDGICQADETTSYSTFTARSLRAAFNYKWAHAEPGAWAHNPRYAIEILFDAILDLRVGNGETPTLANTAQFRSFNGHFGGARAAAPYRALVYSAFPATSGFSSAACYQCHGGQVGFEQYLSSAPTGSALTTAGKVTGLQCTVCHAPAAGDADFTRIRTVDTVYFPPGKNPAAVPSPNQVAFAAADLPTGFAVCATCHSGRENGTSVDIRIGSLTDADWTISFTNPHYLGAAGVLMGSNAGALYQYAGQTYAGYPVNWDPATNGNAPGPHGSPHGASCTGCHQPRASKHTFEVDFAYCDGCHIDATGSGGGDYRLAPKKLEVEEAAHELYVAIQTYATSQGRVLCYNGASHPYWFVDDDSDGTCSTAVQARLNPRAAKAAYNFKWAHAEPGAYAHNLEYMMQALYDSIVDLGGTPTFARP